MKFALTEEEKRNFLQNAMGPKMIDSLWDEIIKRCEKERLRSEANWPRK